MVGFARLSQEVGQIADSGTKGFDYDPMIYDVMRETANYLTDAYSHLADVAKAGQTPQALTETMWQIACEADRMGVHDVKAAQAKTTEFTQQLHRIMGADGADAWQSNPGHLRRKAA